MNTIRRTMLQAGLAAIMALPALAQAQSYPAKPIRLLVPFAPGGAVDQTARIIGQRLGETLGQTIVVENKPGAGGAIAAADIQRSAPDGYTLMLALDTQAANHLIMKNLSYDTFKDFDYLNLLVTTPQILVTRKGLPVSNFDEFITYLKQNPGTTYGTSGVASAGNINGAQMALAQDLEIIHVPYRGAGPMISDLLGGHIDFAFAGESVLLPHIKAGAVQAMALGSSARSARLPDIPTLSERIGTMEYPTWIGLTAPIGLPADVREKLVSATQSVMQEPQIVDRFVANSFDVVNSTPEAFRARLQHDSDLLERLISQKVITTE